MLLPTTIWILPPSSVICCVMLFRSSAAPAIGFPLAPLGAQFPLA